MMSEQSSNKCSICEGRGYYLNEDLKVIDCECRDDIVGEFESMVRHFIKREGIEELLTHLRESGFYRAPASSKYHLCYAGGLARHSLNVLYIALDELDNFSHSLDYTITQESVAICSLFHDLGKHKCFGRDFYIPNLIRDGKAIGSNPYKRNSSHINISHEIASVIELSKFIELSEDETWAILQHNGMYGELKYSLQGKETPLFMIIHHADMWASRVIERGE